MNGAISEAGKHFPVEKKEFLERNAKKEKPQDGFKEATDASLDKYDFLVWLDRFDALYTRAAFNDKDRFEFLRAAVTHIPQISTVTMHRGVINYGNLRKAVRDF